MPPPAGGEGMTGNRVPRFRHTVHIGRWRTRPPTNTLPGVHIMRHSEPASWPSPLRGSTFRSSLDSEDDEAGPGRPVIHATARGRTTVQHREQEADRVRWGGYTRAHASRGGRR